MDESVLLVADCGSGFTFGSGPDYIPDGDTRAMNWPRRRIATRAVCFWEQDTFGITEPDEVSGPNHGLTLRRLYPLGLPSRSGAGL